jgi:hypothetical protein
MVWVVSRFPEEIDFSSCETSVVTEAFGAAGAARSWKLKMLEAEAIDAILMRGSFSCTAES